MTDKPKHIHDWKIAYVATHNGESLTRSVCNKCQARKSIKGKPDMKRLSNMGGEFSTNWSG